MNPAIAPTAEPTEQPGSACPRCGDGFHCGAQDAGPCACTGLKLSAALQQDLRLRYQGCLCLACLRHLSEPNT
ncbi:MAG: cysteine-rich CWC family protein [Vitreoscilla sp.]|nr:cysteine-rich CWC family protein [Burkholderiales bacterium]MBP6337985.1 cysteine-rich CWC family protein [Vitreoscilla sp.]MBP6674945.1 cysteine-rich CWC family protein [Vitreoscilla sp.]